MRRLPKRRYETMNYHADPSHTDQGWGIPTSHSIQPQPQFMLHNGELNRMEDNDYNGIEADLNQIEKEQEEERKRKMADSRWRIVEPNKTASMQWTGKILKRDASYEGSPVPKLGAECLEVNSKGEHKVFEVGANSSAAREMVRIIKKAKADNTLPVRVFVKRTGEKSSTRYEISEAE